MVDEGVRDGLMDQGLEMVKKELSKVLNLLVHPHWTALMHKITCTEAQGLTAQFEKNNF